MSRTAHHTPSAHWNQRAVEAEPDDRFEPFDRPLGHVVYDLRYFAGARRVPDLVRIRVRSGGLVYGHGGSSAVGDLARSQAGARRSVERAFAAEAVKAHRAGRDLDGLLEPEGRTRHGAIWDVL